MCEKPEDVELTKRAAEAYETDTGRKWEFADDDDRAVYLEYAWLMAEAQYWGHEHVGAGRGMKNAVTVAIDAILEGEA